MRSWLDFHYGLYRSGKIPTTFEDGIETSRFIIRKGGHFDIVKLEMARLSNGKRTWNVEIGV
jgi:hypothetical protein